MEQVIEGEKTHIKVWTDHIEDSARRQLDNLGTLPFIHKHIACMPDVHAGYGSTIGSVIPTKGAIIPSTVGVDIGCGMMAKKLPITASDLPDNLAAVRSAIEAAVPHGRTDNGGLNDRGAWSDTPAHVNTQWSGIYAHLDAIGSRHPKLLRGKSGHAVNTHRHLGTLGTGNHFIEICLDENDDVWVMLHSGSRGIGNRIGTYFIALAKKEMERFFISLPDADLGYFPEGTEYFEDYIEAMLWAQNFAKVNRVLMMEQTLKAFGDSIGRSLLSDGMMAINCHHNYATKENHFGANVWVTRKGAVRARKGDLGIIPGSMGQRSYIVEGLGNPDSFNSCSHGAGRVMSRTKARKTFTTADLIKQTQGVECRKDADVLDEIPGAYKDIDEVMEFQKDLVRPVHTLKQVVCVKG